MPVPRRFDRRPPERDTTRINERIRVPQVRLIGADGEQLGILDTAEALQRAQDADLDLVEVAPGSKPPVTRLLDYSKYKYEQEQKQKQARKHQQQITVREIKFRPKIAQHDYDTKKGHVARFLLHKYKVKVTIMFRGREVAHPERGVAILQRLAEELSALATVEQTPTLDGRNMAMMLAPSKGVLSGQVDSLAAATNGGAQTSDGDGGPAPAEEPTPAAAQAPKDGAGAQEAPAETAEGGEAAVVQSAEPQEAQAAAPAAEEDAKPKPRAKTGAAQAKPRSSAPDGEKPAKSEGEPRKSTRKRAPVAKA